MLYVFYRFNRISTYKVLTKSKVFRSNLLLLTCKKSGKTNEKRLTVYKHCDIIIA